MQKYIGRAPLRVVFAIADVIFSRWILYLNRIADPLQNNDFVLVFIFWIKINVLL
ncbi:MAG: hypothetical protein U1F63_04255 [Chitinivorax sp.]